MDFLGTQDKTNVDVTILVYPELKEITDNAIYLRCISRYNHRNGIVSSDCKFYTCNWIKTEQQQKRLEQIDKEGKNVSRFCISVNLNFFPGVFENKGDRECDYHWRSPRVDEVTKYIVTKEGIPSFQHTIYVFQCSFLYD
jgi:hypothetical protein